jgi:hypothetical protein
MSVTLREEFLVDGVEGYPGPFRPEPNTRERAHQVAGRRGGTVKYRLVSDWVVDDGQAFDLAAEAAGLRREVESLTRQRDAWKQKEAERCEALAHERERLRAFREVLAELVRLKDGPRDDAYRAAKDDAWQAARDVLATREGLRDDANRLQVFREALTGDNAAAKLLRGLVFIGDEVGPWVDQVARDKCIELWCKTAARAIVEAAAREAGLDHA